MTNNHLIERIRSLDKLTPSETKIADFISRHYPETVFENVTSISQKTGVSKATVVRFISRLGYGSFSQFQEHLRSDVVSKLESPIQRYTLKKKQLKKGGKDVLGDNFSYIMKNLQHTHAQIDQDQFAKVARMIGRPKGKLYIMGQRTSFALGYLFYVLLKYLGPHAILLDAQASMLPDVLVDVTKNDLLFVISHRRYAKLSLRVTEAFSKTGAKVILLTDSDFSPLSHLANHQFVVPSDGLSVFHSFCASTALLESLVIAALQYCDKSINERIERAEKLFTEFETFSPGNVLVPQRRELEQSKRRKK